MTATLKANLPTAHSDDHSRPAAKCLSLSSCDVIVRSHLMHHSAFRVLPMAILVLGAPNSNPTQATGQSKSWWQRRLPRANYILVSNAMVTHVLEVVNWNLDIPKLHMCLCHLFWYHLVKTDHTACYLGKHKSAVCSSFTLCYIISGINILSHYQVATFCSHFRPPTCKVVWCSLRGNVWLESMRKKSRIAPVWGGGKLHQCIILIQRKHKNKTK